jgi:hypothetical protein
VRQRELPNRLPDAILEDDEIPLSEIGYRATGPIRDGDADLDEVRARSEDRRLLDGLLPKQRDNRARSAGCQDHEARDW